MGWKRLGMRLERHDNKPGVDQESVVMDALVAQGVERLNRSQCSRRRRRIGDRRHGGIASRPRGL